MSFTYRNKNTGDLHEVNERDTRLDHLDNWELVDAKDVEGNCPTCGRPRDEVLATDGILSRPGMETAVSTNGSTDTSVTGNNSPVDEAKVPAGQHVNDGGPQSGSDNRLFADAPKPGKRPAARS